MSSTADHTSLTPEEARLARKNEAGNSMPQAAPRDAAGMLRHLQRTAGNRAVNALLQRAAWQRPGGGIQRSSLLQRDETDDNTTQSAYQDPGTQQDPASQQDPGTQPDPNQQGDGGLQAVSGQQELDLPTPEPITLPIDSNSGPGDYNVPSDQDTMMAKHIGLPFIQRDDTPPQGSASGGSGGGSGQPDNSASVQSTTTVAGPRQAPFQMQVTRTIHLIPPLSLDKLHIDFFQDPQISIGLDSQGTLSAQIAQNIFTAHLLPNWRTPIDLGLAAVWQQNIVPNMTSQQGGQLQAEGHVTKTFSVILNVQGMRTDSEDGKSRVWSVTGGAGIISYF